MIKNKILWLVLLTNFAGLFAQVDEKQGEKKTPELDEVLVTSSRYQVDPWKVGSSVDIITSKDIERLASPTVREILNNLTGLRTSANGVRSTSQSIFIRGTASTGTKIFVDGIEQFYAGGGSPFFYLDVNNIERIEVIKGGGATFYGADVFGGVINIISKKNRSKPIALDGFFEGGSFSTFKESLKAHGYLNGFTYSASILREDSEGLSKAKNTNSGVYFDSDRYQNTDVSVSLGYEKENHRLQIKTRYQEVFSEYDGGAFIDALQSFVEEKHLYQNVFYSGKASFYDYSIAYNYHWSDTTNHSSFGNRQILERHAGYWQNNLVFKPIRTSLGVDFFAEETESYGSTNFPATNHNVGLYLDVAREVGKYFNFSAGVRYDFYQDFDDQLSYRVAVAGTYEDFKLSASYGRAVRSPSLGELDPLQFGNPNLQQQTGDLVDVGFSYRNKKLALKASVTYFFNDTRNLIYWEPNIGTFGALTNLDYRAQGVEIGFAYDIPISGNDFGITTRAAYTYTAAGDPFVDNQQTILRPEHQANLNLGAYLWKSLNVNFDLDYVGETFSFDRNPVSDYFKLDLSLSYALNLQGAVLLTPYLRIENILNQDYVTVEGYSEPGVSFYAGVRFKY